MRKEVTPTETQINVLTVELAENLKYRCNIHNVYAYTLVCV